MLNFTLAVIYCQYEISIDWSSIRVICIAPEYKKYDIHAVQMMGANIELWQYRYYQNEILYFEEVFKKSVGDFTISDGKVTKNPVMVKAGKKAAITRVTGVYAFADHIGKLEKNKRSLVTQTQEYILGLDESVEETPKKFYVAYKISQNFVCLEVHKSKILLYLKIAASDLEVSPSNGRDVTDVGHYGTGNFELTILCQEDVEKAKEYIQMSFNNIGGN